MEKISAWNLTKVKSKKEVIDEARTRAQKFISPHWWTYVIFEKWLIGGKNPKIQRSSCTPRWHCKRRSLDLMQYLQNKDRQLRKRPLQSDGCYCEVTMLCWTSRRRRTRRRIRLLLRSKWKTRQIFKIPKSECPDIWRRLPRHKWQPSWSNIEDPVVLLKENLYGHTPCWPLVGKRVRRSSVGTWMGQSSTELGMSLFIENKDYSCRWIKSPM